MTVVQVSKNHQNAFQIKRQGITKEKAIKLSIALILHENTRGNMSSIGYQQILPDRGTSHRPMTHLSED